MISYMVHFKECLKRWWCTKMLATCTILKVHTLFISYQISFWRGSDRHPEMWNLFEVGFGKGDLCFSPTLAAPNNTGALSSRASWDFSLILMQVAYNVMLYALLQSYSSLSLSLSLSSTVRVSFIPDWSWTDGKWNGGLLPSFWSTNWYD